MSDTSHSRLAAEELRVATIGPEQSPSLRRLRLSALADSPAAFSGELKVESAWDDAHWAAECSLHRWFLITVHAVEAGLAKLVTAPAGDRYLESVWVARPFRRRGVATALVGAVEASVRADGQPVLSLWVVDTNRVARGMYVSLGYRATGRVQPFGADGRTEEELTKVLA